MVALYPPAGLDPSKNLSSGARMSQDLDLSLRTLWAAAPSSILQWATGRPQTRLLRMGETQLPSLRRDLDTVALAEDPDHGRFVFHLEGESRIGPEDLRRFSAYAALLHQKYGLPVRTFVLLMERPSRMSDDHIVNFAGQMISFHAVKLLRLYQIPAGKLLDQPALRALVALGRAPKVADLAEARRRIEEERSENWKDMLGVLYTTASKVFPPAIYKAILFSEAIMESPVFLEILKMGEQRGEQRARTLAQENLRLTLETRFPRLAQKLSRLIDTMEVEEAQAMFRVALTAGSEQEVLAAL